MLNRLARKFAALFVLCAALMIVASAPASAANGGPSRWGPFCLRDPSFADCPSQIVCCTGFGDCTCMQ
jgi:hypothetical protein